jgi:putative glutamine transport system substrate-binding protein
MAVMKRVAGFAVSLLFLALFILACGASPEKSPQIKAIRKRGVLRVGVETNVPGIAYPAPRTGILEGFEIDLARAVAKELMKDQEAVQFIPVSPQLRGPLLDNGDVDMVIAHYTITEERRKRYNFTSPYFTDEVGVLVKKDAGFRKLEDMNGRIAGVLKSATSRAALEAASARRGVSLEYEEFASHPETMAALLAGKVDAFVIDRNILLGYRDDNTMLLDEGFDPQPYGIATRLDRDALAAYLDSIVRAMGEDGRLDALRAKWGL